MKYKQTGNCPYCDAERGVQTIWGMGPQGWANLKERHDAGHPENDAKEQGEELCSHGREKWACLWPHKQPKKEQGECKHNWKLTPDTWGETCFYCGKQRKIKTTPSPLEIEETKEISLPYSDAEITINKLIRNQKKLYQFIKDKQK